MPIKNVVDFKTCVKTISVSADKKIQVSQYKQEGKYPIIDQGDGFIAGYTNDSRKLMSGLGEVIIFGDHTKRFKYVNFPFCVGADGTKILKVTNENLLTKFLFYQLRQTKFPEAGYSRHYKFMASKKISIPPKDIQIDFVKKLDKLTAIVEKSAIYEEKLQTLINSYYISLFGDPIQNEMSYPVKKIGSVAEVNMGGTPLTTREEYYKNGKLLWMKSGDIKKDFVRENDIPNRITDLGLKNSNAKPYKKGSVVIALNGQGKTRATNAILLTDTTSNQSVANFLMGQEVLSEYLHFNLKYRYYQLRALTGDKSRSGLNLHLLRNLDLVCPPIDLQGKFSLFVNKIENIRLLKDKSINLTNALNKQISGQIVDLAEN